VQQDCELLAARNLLYSSVLFRVICMGEHGMVDESIALLEETHLCERMDLQILCSRHCLGLGGFASRSGGDLRMFSGCNLRSYVRDSDPKKYWKKAVSSG
jgi:hypothetical protein